MGASSKQTNVKPADADALLSSSSGAHLSANSLGSDPSSCSPPPPSASATGTSWLLQGHAGHLPGQSPPPGDSALTRSSEAFWSDQPKLPRSPALPLLFTFTALSPRQWRVGPRVHLSRLVSLTGAEAPRRSPPVFRERTRPELCRVAAVSASVRCHGPASRAKGGQSAAADCFGAVSEPSVVFTFLNGWGKKSEE